jgi:HPt (histidine-containing phosphotransfer) domain-containing protein
VIEELRARFGPKLITVARERLREARTLLHERPPNAAIKIARTLHALSGEAAMLGLTDLAGAVRGAEAVALAAVPDANVLKDCTAHFDVIEQKIADLNFV